MFMPAIETLLKINQAMTPNHKVKIIEEAINQGIDAY